MNILSRQDYLALRNLFDQYDQPENRLTHALMCCLEEDRTLLEGFVSWATGERIPAGTLHLLEQSLPGEIEALDSEDAERRGLPDGCIHDDNGWSLLIESKIAARLESEQLRRHRITAERHGLPSPFILALVADAPKNAYPGRAYVRKWTDLYQWMKLREPGSEWAKKLSSYMDVLEAKLSDADYLKRGTLTVFTGIRFNSETPYSYLEAKRVLGLAMDNLRMRVDLRRELRIDPDRPGRPAIKGKDASHVWDFLWLTTDGSSTSFRKAPHLSVGVHKDYLNAFVIIPNEIRADYRRHLLEGGIEGFTSLFESILEVFDDSLGAVAGAVPWVELVQRRYPSQSSDPFIDAELSFDLRTGFTDLRGQRGVPKLQPQWLSAAFAALSNKNSNLQLGVGARFSYDRCPDAADRSILDHIAAAWLACKPLIDKMFSHECE